MPVVRRQRPRHHLRREIREAVAQRVAADDLQLEAVVADVAGMRLEDGGIRFAEADPDVAQRQELDVVADQLGQPAPDLARPVGQRQLRQETRSEEHTSELQSLMRISYAVFCLTK